MDSSDSDRDRLVGLFNEWRVVFTRECHCLVVDEGYSGIPVSFMFTEEGAFIGIDCDLSNTKR